jgi:hypothetical protein
MQPSLPDPLLLAWSVGRSEPLQPAAGIADEVSIEPAAVPEYFGSELVQLTPLRAGEALQQVEGFL